MITKLKFKREILKYIFLNFFYKLFLIYIKISKTLSAKYYQENKEKLQKKPLGRYQNLSKEEQNITE